MQTTTTSRSSTTVFDWLRFPLAIAIIFSHNFGARAVDKVHFLADPLSWQSAYDLFRVLFSKVLPSVAVPTFFMISGYLIFLSMRDWDWRSYGQKLRRRTKSLLLPYLLWNAFHAIHLAWPTILKVLHGQRSIDSLWRFWDRLGGLRMFWDSHLAHTEVNCLGISMPFAGPVLMPLWYLRDLMILVLCLPVIYWALRHFGRWLLLFLGVCYGLNLWIPFPGLAVRGAFWFIFGAYFSLNGLDLVEALYRRRHWAYSVYGLTLLPWLFVRLLAEDPALLPFRILNLLNVAAAVVSVVSLGATLEHRGRLKVVPWLAQSSFFIYCSHIFVRKQVLHVVSPHIPSSCYPARLVSFLLVPFATALICMAVRQLAVLVGRLARMQKTRAQSI